MFQDDIYQNVKVLNLYSTKGNTPLGDGATQRGATYDLRGEQTERAGLMILQLGSTNQIGLDGTVTAELFHSDGTGAPTTHIPGATIIRQFGVGTIASTPITHVDRKRRIVARFTLERSGTLGTALSGAITYVGTGQILPLQT